MVGFLKYDDRRPVLLSCTSTNYVCVIILDVNVSLRMIVTVWPGRRLKRPCFCGRTSQGALYRLTPPTQQERWVLPTYVMSMGLLALFLVSSLLTQQIKAWVYAEFLRMSWFFYPCHLSGSSMVFVEIVSSVCVVS